MAKKKVKPKNYFGVVYGQWWNDWHVAVSIGQYAALGARSHDSRKKALRAAKRLSAKTGWPVVEK